MSCRARFRVADDKDSVVRLEHRFRQRRQELRLATGMFLQAHKNEAKLVVLMLHLNH